MRIFYNKVASKRRVKILQKANGQENRWQQQALPLGNGTLGITLMGEPFAEEIVVNEKSLWTGGPSPKRENYCGGNISEIDGKKMSDIFKSAREKLAKGEDAEGLCEKLVGGQEGYGSFQCAGILKINGKKKKYNDYEFELDLDSAISTCKWKEEGGRVERKAFVSYPDKVAVIEQKSDCPSDFGIVFDSHAQGKTDIKINDGRLILGGNLDDNNLAYAMAIDATCDGELKPIENGWQVVGAKNLTIIFTYMTDYADEYPHYRTGESLDELKAKAVDRINKASTKGLDELTSRHILDWQSAYGNFEFSLNAKESDMPTDKLLAKYSKANGNDRKWLETLLFAYGRYLLVASSRKDDSLPCNLQGIWNISNSPIWASDYHLNINLQMNYWLAPLCGLTD